MSLAIRDAGWIRSSFLMAAENNSDKSEAFWRLQTSANEKFTDSRLGGNFAINNFPQFTRHADIRRSGVNLANKTTQQRGLAGLTTGENLGMGRYYSEAIDDNQQRIHLQFGVPEYNGMFSFFTSFFDGDAGTLASEGRHGIFYYIGKVAGLALGVAVLVTFPWLLLGFAGVAAFRFAAGEPSSKYYYLRPTMALYWNRVNFIANGLAVNMGLMPRVFRDTDKMQGEGGDQGREYDPGYMKFMADNSGGIFREGGGVDVYGLSNKAQRMADMRREKMKQVVEVENGTTQSILSSLFGFVSGDAQYRIADDNVPVIEDYLKDYFDSGFGNIAYKSNDPNINRLTAADDLSTVQAEQPPTAEGAPAPASTPAPQPKGFRSAYAPAKDETGADIQVKKPGVIDDFLQRYTANRRDGNAFVTFNVEHTGSVSESFASSVKESDIASKMNGFSSSARNLRFSLSEGNTGIGVIDGIKGAVTSMAAGVLDGFQVSGILALAGSAFVDIPKHFESSSATFPTASYKIELRTPYGNKLSRFINLYVPLSCLLAGALPLSTGKQSYTAPFICSLFDRGRCQSKLSMITALSVTRGVGNMGWNNRQECLGIDVTFDVTDLSSVMHAPIEPGSLLPWKNILDDDSAFSQYMATLGNLSMADMYYPSNKLALNLTRKREYYDTFFSAGSLANMTENIWGVRHVGTLLGIVARGTER